MKIARASALHQLALLNKCEHARQRVLDDVCAILVHFAAETNWVRHIAPHRCPRLFKFAEQKCFIGALGKQCLDRFDVSTGHGKNVRGAIDQGRRDRLAALAADVHAFLFADLHRVKTWRLAADGMHARRKNFDVSTVTKQTAKKPFRDWAATNIAGTDKEDAFHVSGAASARHAQPRSERVQVNQGNACSVRRPQRFRLRASNKKIRCG